MQIAQQVRCPNCGSFAKRQWIRTHQITADEDVVETSCSRCDYLMIMGSATGKVIEAYAPGQPPLDYATASTKRVDIRPYLSRQAQSGGVNPNAYDYRRRHCS